MFVTEAPDLSAVAVLIPAWKPEVGFVGLVQALAKRGVGAIVLIDDGSGAQSEAMFDEVRGLPSVHVVCHAVNLGKGRALKTGFNHCLAELPDVCRSRRRGRGRSALSEGYCPGGGVVPPRARAGSAGRKGLRRGHASPEPIRE